MMKLAIRVDRALNETPFRTLVEHRSRFALTRLGPKLLDVTVRVRLDAQRDGGQYEGRISANLRAGGQIHVRCTDSSPRGAVDRALDRFRRTLNRAEAAKHTARRRGGPIGVTGRGRDPGFEPTAVRAAS